MKKTILFLLIVAMFALVACNSETESKNTDTTELVPLEVDLTISPNEMNPGDEVTFLAVVTQGDETVEDADEVQFEIRQNANGESEFLDGEHQSNGEYTAVKTFDSEGIYSVTAHVTARSMHTMPTVEVVIGNPEVADELEGETTDTNEHHHHGSGDIAIDFPLEAEYIKGKQSTVQVSFEESNVLLTDARVRFEIWKDGADKHEFIDASETDEGVYQSEYTFAESGTYHVQVHLEKGDIHEHLEKSTTVK
ncbi:FixH family protein [Bacillus nitroreducens]